MLKRKLHKIVEPEVSKYPGATVNIQSTNNNHLKIILIMGDRQRFVTASKTASCSRSSKNLIGDVRRALAMLASQQDN